jgi:hypothetical protein
MYLNSSNNQNTNLNILLQLTYFRPDPPLYYPALYRWQLCKELEVLIFLSSSLISLNFSLLNILSFFYFFFSTMVSSLLCILATDSI